MSRYRQTMAEAYAQVQVNENDYLKSKLTDTQIANIKQLWMRKTARDVTPSVKDMIKKMDIPTQLAIKHANINQLSKLVEAEDHEVSMAIGQLKTIGEYATKLQSILQSKGDDYNIEAWVQAKITSAEDYINSVGHYMENNPDVSEELKETFSNAQIAVLKKQYEPLRNKKISMDNANKLGQLFTKFDKDKNALEKLYGGDIPFVSTMAMTRLMTKHGYKADQLNKIRKEELEEELFAEGVGHISGFRDDKEKANMISLAKQHGLKVDSSGPKLKLSGNMRKILDMQLAAQGNGLKAEEFRLSLDEAKFTDQQIKMAYGVANDPRYKSGNYSGAVSAIEKIAKGLSSHPAVQNVLKRTNENLDEGKMSQIDQMQKDGKSAAEIAKLMKLDVKTVKSILGEEVCPKCDGEGCEHCNNTGYHKEETLHEFKKMTVTFKSMADMAKASTDLAKHGFTINAKGMVMKVDGKGDDLNKYATDLKNFYKADIRAESYTIDESADEDFYNPDYEACWVGYKKVGMKKKGDKMVPNCVPESVQEAKDEEKKEDDSDKLKGDIQKKDAEIAALKQKSETDKTKAVAKDTKKMVNPETGEPLLQVGIAYKHLKDKMKKEKEEVKEMANDKAYAIGMATAKKKYNDEPPLDKKTIKKGHEIGDKLSKMKNEDHPAKQMFEQIEGLKNKAEKSGMPYGILKKVYDRGMAAWRGGHRPGTTQQQWAFARVNSFITKSSGTWGGADKDLAAKVKGK